jgi:hypothetical protein
MEVLHMSKHAADIRGLWVILVLLAVLPGIAAADAVTWDGFGEKSKVRFHYPSSPFDGSKVYAGQLSLEYHDQELLGYCIAPDKSAHSFNATEISPLSLQNGLQVAWLFENYGPSVHDGTSAAALQVAIWELVGEDSSNPWDVTGGLLWIDKNDDVSDAAEALLDSLAGVDFSGYTPQATTVVLDPDNASYQGMMIPEPATVGVLVLGGLGVIVRRRR